MLTYFPEIISGELLYSVLARYSAHEGLSGPGACAADLFGLKHAVASVDLPNRLDTLASRIGLRGFDGARLAREHTLLPYYTAYRGETIRQLAEERLRTGRGEVHLKLGVATFSIARETVLRFCPECFEAMIAERGEAWWRRDHQLPGVLVCPDHGCPLRRSTLDTRKENRHGYLPATEANCPADAASACRIADEADRERFLALARASAALLDDPPPPRDFLALTERYRRRLRAAGLMRWQEKVDLPALDRAMRAHWGGVLEQIPGVLDNGLFSNGWLSTLVRQQRRAFHPVCHLLLEGLLDTAEATEQPFGDGPWVCWNPLSDHFGEPVVTSIRRLRWKGRSGPVSALMTCGCGYVYAQSLAPGGGLARRTFREYGPLLEPELRRLATEGGSLEGASRALGLDPVTVARLAKSLGIETVWSAPRPVRRKLPELPVGAAAPAVPVRGAQCQPGLRGPRKDWAAIDAEWCRRIRLAADETARLQPPVRMSPAELARRAGPRDWWLKRRHKLPETTQLIELIGEDVAAFQERRARYHMAALAADGRGLPAAWQVVRAAGLTSGALPLVEGLVADYGAVPGRDDPSGIGKRGRGRKRPERKLQAADAPPLEPPPSSQPVSTVKKLPFFSRRDRRDDADK